VSAAQKTGKRKFSNQKSEAKELWTLKAETNRLMSRLDYNTDGLK